MRKIMPQEIEVWYLIPSLRKEIAKVLMAEHKMNQKRIAEIFGVTEAAISQYLSSKRASEIKFPKKELGRIKKTADKIARDRKNSMEYLSQLSKKIMGDSKTICDLHKKYDPSVPHRCEICSKN